MQTVTIAVFAAVSSAVSASMYGMYGTYGTYATSPDFVEYVMPIDEMAAEPVPVVMAVEPVPVVMAVEPVPVVMAAEPVPALPVGSDVMAVEEFVGEDEALIPNCMVQHNRDGLELCEQCAPGFFQYYDVDGNILCFDCLLFSPSCKVDEAGVAIGCQSFQGCPNCSDNLQGVEFDVEGTEFDFPSNSIKICEADA